MSQDGDQRTLETLLHPIHSIKSLAGLLLLQLQLPSVFRVSLEWCSMQTCMRSEQAQASVAQFSLSGSMMVGSLPHVSCKLSPSLSCKQQVQREQAGTEQLGRTTHCATEAAVLVQLLCKPVCQKLLEPQASKQAGMLVTKPFVAHGSLDLAKGNPSNHVQSPMRNKLG
jgi:hypothetical protein